MIRENVRDASLNEIARYRATICSSLTLASYLISLCLGFLSCTVKIKAVVSVNTHRVFRGVPGLLDKF